MFDTQGRHNRSVTHDQDSEAPTDFDKPVIAIRTREEAHGFLKTPQQSRHGHVEAASYS
jgi:hypothetical protein